MPEDERVFSLRLHDAEVKVICHDALHMSQLQRDIAQPYGLLPSVFWAHVIFLVLGCASATH